MSKGQLSLPVIEGAIGVIFLIAIVFTIAAGGATAAPAEPQLDAYASDTANLLAHSLPQHAGQTRIGEITNEEALKAEREVLKQRIDRILPAHLLFRVETQAGAIGFERPRDTPTGSARLYTQGGPVAVQVWFA